MEAPQGKYYKEIVAREGTGINLANAMRRAKKGGVPYFSYPYDDETSVIFRTPNVPLSREQKKEFDEIFDKKAINENSDLQQSSVSRKITNSLLLLLGLATI